MGARPRSRPHGQLLHRQEGPRQRDDRRAQRVRGGRERPVRRAARARHRRRRTSGTTTASRPSARAPTSRTCPIERLQAFYRNYYQPDNAVLLVAGKFDEAKTLALIDTVLRRRSRARRALLRRSTPQEPAQDGERIVTLRRVGDVQLVMARLPRARRARTRTSPPSTCSTQVLGDTPVGPAAQGAGRDEEGELASTASASSCASRASPSSAPRCARTRSLDAARDALLADRRGRRREPADQGGGRARAHAAAQEHRARR